MDPEKLLAQFPQLSDDDLAAYVEITRRILSDPAARGRAMAEVLTRARTARGKQAAGQGLDGDESLALRYLNAVEKMQGRTRSGGG